MANGEWNKNFSVEQASLNERLAAHRGGLNRLAISQETMDKMHTLAETDRVKQLVSEFEASPSAQGFLQALGAANEKLDAILDSKEMCALSELADAQANGATDSELMAMARSKGVFDANAAGQQAMDAVDSAIRGSSEEQNTMLGYLVKTQGQSAMSSEDYNREADGLVFSYLAYASKFAKDVSVSPHEHEYFELATTLSEGETIGSYAGKLYKWCEDNSESKISSNDLAFLKNIRDSDKYKDLEIAYLDYASEAGKVQDLVIAVKYSDGGVVVAFEGTDGTYNGWETDFGLFAPEMSPAEEWARDQLESILTKYGENGPVDVTGHSRGGHMAIVSVVAMDDTKVSPAVIRSVTGFDPPGFSKDFISENEVTIGKYLHLIRNFYVENTAFGVFGEPIGERIFVSMEENKILGASHDSYCWAINDSGHFIITEQALESRILEEAIRYAFDTLTYEEVGVLYAAVLETLRSGVNGEYIGDGMFEEGAPLDQIILELIGRISDSGLADAVTDTMAQLMLNHPATELIGKIRDTVSTIDKVTGILAKIPVLTPYLAPVVLALEVLDVTLMIVDWGLQLAYTLHQINVEKRTSQYLEDNPVISFRFSDLEDIATKLANIERLIASADSQFESLGSSRYWEAEAIDFVTLGGTVLLDMVTWLGLNLGGVKNNPTIGKMSAAINEIKDTWRRDCDSISSQLGVSAQDNEITVMPGKLSKYAQAMQDELENMEKRFSDAVGAIKELGTKEHWSNDDNDKFQALVQKESADVNLSLNNAKSNCGAMVGAGAAYVKLQENSYRLCDDATHKWYNDFKWW